MTTDTDHDRTVVCGHPSCRAHQPCSCPFASITPHLAVGCRYTTDHDDEGPPVNIAGELTHVRTADGSRRRVPCRRKTIRPRLQNSDGCARRRQQHHHVSRVEAAVIETDQNWALQRPLPGEQSNGQEQHVPDNHNASDDRHGSTMPTCAGPRCTRGRSDVGERTLDQLAAGNSTRWWT